MSTIITRSRANSQPSTTPPFLPKSGSGRQQSSSSTGKLKVYNQEERMKPNEENKGENSEETNLFKKNINPEDVTPATWLVMFNTLNSTLVGLQNDIKELKEIKGTVSTYSTAWKETVDQTLAELDEKSENQDFQVKLLKNMVINQEEKIKFLENKVTAAYEREIKSNMIIHGILEVAEETHDKLLELVSGFFAETMLIQQTITLTDAYRMGEGKGRSIMIKLKFPSDKAIIYEHASNLKGKMNARKKLYFIQDDLSDIQQEQRNSYRDLVRENKEKDQEDQLNIKMKRGKVMVNNEAVKSKVQPPEKADILRMNEKELEKVKAIKVVSGPEHIEKGSEFYTYGCKVQTTRDVEKAYTKMKIKFADASHIICAYRLDTPVGPFRQQVIDDNDHGMG